MRLFVTKNLVFYLTLLFCFCCQANARDINTQRDRPLIKILAIDGGGVRGMIPAYIINELEKKLPKGKKVAEYFDIVAGTSAGGILALLLTTPNPEGKPKYSAEFILNNMIDFSEVAFQKSFWRRIYTGGGLWHVKYSSEGLQSNLAKYFGDIKLSQTTSNVIIPTYEIEQDKTFF